MILRELEFIYYLLLFVLRQGLKIQDLIQISCVAKDNLELLILLPPLMKYKDYRHGPPSFCTRYYALNQGLHYNRQAPYQLYTLTQYN